MTDVESVGGKNASLGEMIGKLAGAGVAVPDGFATTAQAYRDFLAQDGLGKTDRGRARGPRRRRRHPPRGGGRAHPRLDPRNAVPERPGARGACRGRRARQWILGGGGALFGDRRGPSRRVIRGPAGNDPERSRGAVGACGHAPGLCFALQRPRHFLPRAPGVRPHPGRDLGRRTAHGAQRRRRKRRDVHARHRVRIPRRRVHHRLLGAGRAGGPGRGEPGRVLRLQAGVARGPPRGHPPQPRFQGLAHGIRRRSSAGPLGGHGGCGASRPRPLLHRRRRRPRARAAGTGHRGPLRLPDGHRMGKGRRNRQRSTCCRRARRPCRAGPGARSCATR